MQFNRASGLRRYSEIPLPASTQCDGLSRNLPGELQTIVANCLTHSRRRFVDVFDRFRDECEYVLEVLKIVYRTDAEARRKKLSPAKRLQLHRTKSQQAMTRLHNWLKLALTTSTSPRGSVKMLEFPDP